MFSGENDCPQLEKIRYMHTCIHSNKKARKFDNSKNYQLEDISPLAYIRKLPTKKCLYFESAKFSKFTEKKETEPSLNHKFP